jgi:hypothetical protein
MTGRRDSWYDSAWFVRLAKVLAVLEMAGGLALLVVKHDGPQGYAFLAIGAATLSSIPLRKGFSAPHLPLADPRDAHSVEGGQVPSDSQ